MSSVSYHKGVSGLLEAVVGCEVLCEGIEAVTSAGGNPECGCCAGDV